MRNVISSYTPFSMFRVHPNKAVPYLGLVSGALSSTAIHNSMPLKRFVDQFSY